MLSFLEGLEVDRSFFKDLAIQDSEYSLISKDDYVWEDYTLTQ